MTRTFCKLDVRGSMHHSTIHTEKSNKMQQSIKIYYFIFIWSSTCFGRHTTHHQELKTAASDFAYVKGCWTCGCWEVSDRVSLCLTTAWMSVACGCCLFSGTGLCVRPIPLSEKSYWLSCVLLSMISHSPQQGGLRPSGVVAPYEKKNTFYVFSFLLFWNVFTKHHFDTFMHEQLH
jgi:hypothetical protein